MFCRQCGCEISNEAKFCNFCGTKTVAPKARKGESDNSLDANMPADGKNEIEANKKPAASSSDCAEANYESGSAIEEEKNKREGTSRLQYLEANRRGNS